MSNYMSHTFDNVKAANRYMFGGNAVVTVQSVVTNKHYTYRIWTKKDDTSFGDNRTPLYFVGVRAGERYRYIGYIKDDELRAGNKGTPGADSFKAFQWLLRQVTTRHRLDIHPQMILRHEGTCGRCGRQLTHPESLNSGIGPVCATKG